MTTPNQTPDSNSPTSPGWTPSPELRAQHKYVASEGNEADRAAFNEARDAEQAAWNAANPGGSAPTNAPTGGPGPSGGPSGGSPGGPSGWTPSPALREQHRRVMSEGNEADRAAFGRARDAEKAAWEAANPSASNPTGPGASPAASPSPVTAGPPDPAEATTGPSPTWNASDFQAFTGLPLSDDPAANSRLIADTRAKNDADFLTYTGEAPTGDYDTDRATWERTTETIKEGRAKWSKDFEEYNGRPPTDDPEENARITAATTAQKTTEKAKQQAARTKYRKDFREFTGRESTGNAAQDQAIINKTVADDAALAEVDRVPDSRNAGLAEQYRRQYRELTGQESTGDAAKDREVIDRVIADDAAQAEVDRVPNSRNAGLSERYRRQYRELTGQESTGDAARDREVIDRVIADDAAQAEVDRAPDSRTAGLPPRETGEVAKVAPNSNRPLQLLVDDAQKVQRSGPGHPEFQDVGATQRITAETLKAGGTIYINGEPVDVGELVRQNTVYPDSVGSRGRGSSQRQATYERTVQQLAAKLQAGQAQGSVSTLPRPAPTGPALTWDTLPTHATLDGQRYSLDDIITANMTPAERTGVRGRSQREVGNVADRARVLAQINDLYQKGRFVPEGSDGSPAPYFNPDTRKGVNAGDLPDLLIPGAGFVTSIHDSRAQQSPGGPIVSPGESRGIAIEGALAAAEVLTIPASGAASLGVKRLANTVKNPAGNVALNRFRRETADLVASGLDPSTARQVAATNQGQTVADMARLEKGLTSPKVDPYAGLSTGQQTIDDAARAANNAAEVERKLTGSRETPETLARRLQNQQHATNQKTADTLLREIDNKAAANKQAFRRGQEIPYPEVDKAVYVKGVNNRRVESPTAGEPPASGPPTSYVDQLRTLDTATRNYNDRWRLPDPPSDGPSPTGWNPDSSGPEYGSRGNFWSAKGTRGDGSVATLERTSQQTALSADERARLLKNAAGRDEFVDIPDVAPPKLGDVVGAPRTRPMPRPAPEPEPAKPATLANADEQINLLGQVVDSPRPTSRLRGLPARADDATSPGATPLTAVAPATALSGALPSTGTDTSERIGTEPVTAGATSTESQAAEKTEAEAQPGLAAHSRPAVRNATTARTGPSTVTRAQQRTEEETQAGPQVTVPGRFPLVNAVNRPVAFLGEPQTMYQPQPAVDLGPEVSIRVQPVEGSSEKPAEETSPAPPPTEQAQVTAVDPDGKIINPLSPDGPSALKRVRVPKLPPSVQLNGRQRVQENEVILPAGEEHPHVVEHETKAVIRTDLRTGEQRVTPIDYRNVETLQVVKRGKESTDGRQVESGALTVTNRRGKVHGVSDPSLTGKGGNVVVPRFPYTPPPAKPAKRRRGGGKRRNGSAGEEQTNRGPTQISVEFGG